MLYNSTQNAKEVVSAAQAIAQGISKDGGLFVPQEFPKYDENTFDPPKISIRHPAIFPSNHGPASSPRL